MDRGGPGKGKPYTLAAMHLPQLHGTAVHLTGIKGTGMAALAEILVDKGAVVTGSDVADRFFTDTLLERVGITPQVGFAPDHVGPGVSLLVYSAAYDESNPERRAAQKRGIPQVSYTQMLGHLSREPRSLAVSGVHGKTTTTAMLGTIIAATSLPATVVVGSAVPTFGGSATLRNGSEYLIAETCEYRRHFLDYHPDVVVVTSVEADHLDYFRDRDDVIDAFVALGHRLPEGGVLVFCADDDGACAVAQRLAQDRPDVVQRPYGFTVEGTGSVGRPVVQDGSQTFTVGLDAGTTQWSIGVPGRHMVSDAAAAITALIALQGEPSEAERSVWCTALSGYRGTSRRSEIVGQAAGVVVVDDYAHHPTEIRTTLEGFREFWPRRRLVVDFMSHTYSRTSALLDDFARAFGAADIVVLNDIYASAREHNHAGMTGRRLYAAVASHHHDVRYAATFPEAIREIVAILRPGDLFVTMGAGDNFRVGTAVLAELADRDTHAGHHPGSTGRTNR